MCYVNKNYKDVDKVFFFGVWIKKIYGSFSGIAFNSLHRYYKETVYF